MIRRPPRSTLFPYRRSSDLSPDNVTQRLLAHVPLLLHPEPHSVVVVGMGTGDRKSTRLNSSHSQISYAVFCLKKKKKNITFGGTQVPYAPYYSQVTYAPSSA